MRLIDADALLLEIAKLKRSPWFNDDSYPGSHAVRKEAVEIIEDLCIKDAPTVDRPQGEWIKRFGSINCSVCKHSNWSDSFEHTVRRFKFCPNCGARMKGADDETD